MRQIHLDLTAAAPPNGSTTFLDISGEHNATDLCIADGVIHCKIISTYLPAIRVMDTAFFLKSELHFGNSESHII